MMLCTQCSKFTHFIRSCIFDGILSQQVFWASLYYCMFTEKQQIETEWLWGDGILMFLPDMQAVEKMFGTMINKWLTKN